MEKPLGLYVFSKRSRFVQDVLDGSFSGGVTFNDAMFHYSVPDLPFGGVGRSGMGSYSFGIEGFRRFSHARRSEEHTYELQSPMRISYAAFSLKKIKRIELYENSKYIEYNITNKKHITIAQNKPRQ